MGVILFWLDCCALFISPKDYDIKINWDRKFIIYYK